MINKYFKMKKRILFTLLFSLVFGLSHGQDTTIRKKYFDSLRNQLAIYTVGSYTNLDLYNKAVQEKNDIQDKYYQVKDLNDEYQSKKERRTNIDSILILLISIMGTHILINHFRYNG